MREGGKRRGAAPRPGAATRAIATRATATRRLRRLLLGAVLAFVALGARLGWLVAVDGPAYRAYAASEVYERVPIPALRGAIYDREGNLLAVTVPRQDVVADDYVVEDPRAEAAALSPLLHASPTALAAALHQPDGYVVLARQVSPSLASKVASLALPGIGLVADPERVDPAGSLFAPVLGIVGFSGHGLSGVEYRYDSLLSGRPGSELVPVAPGGIVLPGTPRDVVPARQGIGLVLTLDEPLQYEVTKDLAAEIRLAHADGGEAVVLDSRTGGILAMVDLVRGPGGAVVPASSNLALTAVYEPGSVMKIATVAGALEEGLVTPSTELTVPYQIDVGGWPFDDAEWHPTEKMPVTQIIAQSSNVGTIEIARMLGEQRLSEFLRRFGFGEPTGLGWPGASTGILGSPATWSAAAMGAVPIGTDEAVTALQVADAYNALANGGVFVPPHLVRALVLPNGRVEPVPLPPRRRVIRASVAAELVPIFEGVTTDANGTALAAQVPGYLVAGKTGTAQIPSTTGPGYTPGAWMGTFVGFVPAQAPRLTAVVVLDHPEPIYGGLVAAPVFSRIMQYALRHFDIPPPTVAGAPTGAPGP